MAVKYDNKHHLITQIVGACILIRITNLSGKKLSTKTSVYFSKDKIFEVKPKKCNDTYKSYQRVG